MKQYIVMSMIVVAGIHAHAQSPAHNDAMRQAAYDTGISPEEFERVEHLYEIMHAKITAELSTPDTRPAEPSEVDPAVLATYHTVFRQCGIHPSRVRFVYRKDDYNSAGIDFYTPNMPAIFEGRELPANFSYAITVHIPKKDRGRSTQEALWAATDVQSAVLQNTLLEDMYIYQHLYGNADTHEDEHKHSI